MSSLKGKVVLITGASAGIGAATAVEFAKHGARVALTGRDLPRLKGTALKCQQAGLTPDQILTVVGDVLEEEDLKNIVQTTLAHFSELHVLVNNAGTVIYKNMMKSVVTDMDAMYKMHVRSVYQLTKLCLPYILDVKGNIVNVSSIASLRPGTLAFPYSMAKAAQDQMMRCLSLELGPKGVRVNSICPGAIQTGIFEKNDFVSSDQLGKMLEELGAIHPLGRIGQPEETAKAIVFLASDEASFISGVALPVDGARNNTCWIPKSHMSELTNSQ